ncbi:MAG: DedA family protein [Methanobacterium sp.]
MKKTIMTTYFENYSNLAINLVETYSYFGVFIGTAFLPSEIVMPLAGFAVSLEKMTLLGITLAAALGDVLGSLIVYFVGYYGGRPLLEGYGKIHFY